MRFSSECFKANAANKLNFVALKTFITLLPHAHLDTAVDPGENMETAETGSAVATAGYFCYCKGQPEEYDLSMKNLGFETF